MAMVDRTRHLLEAIEQWPRESVWLKVLPIERSQVVANVNIAGSELIIDDSKQQPTSNVIGLRGFNNLQRDAATEKVLKKIGKGIKITRDAEGNIYAKQLSKSEIIMKGYKYPEDCCLSSEVVSKLGRLSKHPQKIFDMSKFKSSIATELRNTVIDKRRLMHLCMITFSFVRNVFDDLDTPCWVCLINYAAMATLGTDEMLDAVKESCNIRLTETEDVQMRRNWQQMGCSPASYDMDAMPPQEQFDAMAWHGYGNGIQHPSRPTDQTDGHTDQTGGSSNTPARVRSNSPGYAESIPYTKYEGPPQIGKRREWAKLARKRDSY
ncbi:hypothetical protein NP493_466g01011 [Ridgeia piscesae]|uniref:MH2 domain-containing protein n=1 Tax=Ridgeia piscesae TaxID=27915 RepID=A0AAD9KYU9_RIDPI|nr:hypothetical protein NP493_466g01011 [Ridgeia piscesae]